MATVQPGGINLISLLNPQLGAQQAAIQQQQQLAQQLMAQGSQPTDNAQMANPGGFVVPVSPWAAAAKALEQGAGGYLQGKATADQVNLYKGLANPSRAAGNAALAAGPTDGGGTGPTVANAAIADQLSASRSGGALGGLLPQGLDPNKAALISMLPDELQKVALAQYMPTDQMKNNNYMGLSASEALGQERAKAGKDSADSLRQGNTLLKFNQDGSVTPGFTAAPSLAGASTTYDANGNPSYAPIPITAAPPSPTPPPVASPAPATGAPPNGAPPQGNPQPAPGAIPPAGIRNNNPGNVQGAQFNGATGTDPNGYGQYITPEAGIRATALNLLNQQKLHGLNTVNDIIPKYVQGDPNGAAPYIQDVSNRMGVASDQPLDLTDPRTLTNFTNAIIQHENGKNPYTPDQVNAGVTGALGGSQPPQTQPPARANVMPNAPSPLPKDFPPPAAPSQMTLTQADTAAATGNANSTQQRNSDILAQAGTSPTRLADLQNIYNLAADPSNKFGPGADKTNYYKALAQQIPGIDPSSTDAANYEVAKKYFSNLSGQYQKALGGTGTDKQLDIAMSGTPGPDMLNNAITKVAPFLMGQEKALQAQANMRRAVIDPASGYGGNATQNLQNLEGYWQKNYDPDAFELNSIPPASRAAYIQSLPKDRAATLATSYQKALGAGWIQ